MRAVLCRDTAGSGTLELAEVDVPAPGPGEVRIAAAAAGVNFADSLMITGRYQERPPLPFTPGLEVAGRIDSLGPDVLTPNVGQRVLALLERGGFAEQVIARASDVIPLPDSIDNVTAAGFAIAYGTAHGALDWRAGLRSGETLLVHGAAGGVGLTAVEVGKAMGARVLATARGADKLAIAAAQGADKVLDSEAPELVARLKEELGTSGADVVFDPVGGDLFDASLRNRRLGRPAGGRRLRIGQGAADPRQYPAGQERRGPRLLLGQLSTSRSGAAARQPGDVAGLACTGPAATACQPCAAARANRRRHRAPAQPQEHWQGRGDDREVARRHLQPRSLQDTGPW